MKNRIKTKLRRDKSLYDIKDYDNRLGSNIHDIMFIGIFGLQLDENRVTSNFDVS